MPTFRVADPLRDEALNEAATGYATVLKNNTWHEDAAHNYTRFFVLGRQECPPTGSDKTSLLFLAPHQPGALNEALDHFARRGINRIDSIDIRIVIDGAAAP